MRSFLSLPLAAVFFSTILPAQVVNVNGESKPPLDTRPFGKYLVQVCTLPTAGAPRIAPLQLRCDNPPARMVGPFLPPPAAYPVPIPAGKTPQTITMKLVGDCPPGTNPCPSPVYPLLEGATFFVKATSDSGLIVDQKVVHGNVSMAPDKGTSTQQYAVLGPGTIVIRATVRASQPGDVGYAPAAPVELALTVADAGADKTPAVCAGLPGPATASQTQPQIDLPGIIGLIGNPTPFVLTPQGNNTIFIYSTRSPLNEREIEILGKLPSDIAELAGQRADLLGVTATAKPFKVELQIPHAAALGDLATRIAGLNYSQFTVQDIGSDKVRINATSPPDCPTWSAFLSAIRDMEWQVKPEPFDMKLYYLSSTDAATAFTSLAAGSSAGGSTAAGTAGASPSGSSAPAGGGSGGSTASGTAAGTATIAVNQPPGSVFELKSDTTPCVIAGLTLSNGSGCAPASGSGGAASAAPSGGAAAASPGAGAAAASPKPPGMVAMAVAAGTGEQTPSDLLVFSDANPGDDAQVLERKRILAQLDLPRPEMLINAWVMQNSTANPRAIGTFSNSVKDLVAGYNEALEQVVLKGWEFVQDQIQNNPQYFDPYYFSYIADRYIADTSSDSASSSVQAAAQAFLSNSPAKLADTSPDLNSQFGVCPSGRYCLGYNSLFHPLKPRLTDLLLTLIAADRPVQATEEAIDFVQGTRQPIGDEAACGVIGKGVPELADRCRAIWTNLGLDRALPSSPGTCASMDYKFILGALVRNAPDQPHIYLTCFHEAARTFLPMAGQVRAAIADFLFNYKMSQQYPHEFAPYELSQSADALNSALSPLIDEFNRDIIAFQTFMRADVQYQVERLNRASDERCCVKRLFGLDKPSFFNDGLVSVRTISGQPTQVITTSQSMLDASTAPTLSNLVNSIASPGGSGSTGTSPLAGVLGSPQSSASLLAGVLNAYQTTFAQIGRSLSLSVVPRSLSTASSAEIAVTLNVDETSGGPTYSGGPQGGAAPNTSRVANHDIVTRIRVESIKLFQVSSFSAIVQRSRSRFPLLPPFVEIPYIGTVAGIPIPGAKEYHSSIAVMSAMVVPTAADIAYGLRFVFDQVVDGDAGSCSFVKGSAGPSGTKPCRFRRAVSMVDLNRLPIEGFHEAMIHCFATDMKSTYSSAGSLTSTNANACKNLSFDKVPQEAF
jgi:hypothetical protein